MLEAATVKPILDVVLFLGLFINLSKNPLAI